MGLNIKRAQLKLIANSYWCKAGFEGLIKGKSLKFLAIKPSDSTTSWPSRMARIIAWIWIVPHSRMEEGFWWETSWVHPKHLEIISHSRSHHKLPKRTHKQIREYLHSNLKIFFFTSAYDRLIRRWYLKAGLVKQINKVQNTNDVNGIPG